MVGVDPVMKVYKWAVSLELSSWTFFERCGCSDGFYGCAIEWKPYPAFDHNVRVMFAVFPSKFLAGLDNGD